MNGDYDGKFPQGRALYLYMMLHPGKKLDFMGNEFGQLRNGTKAVPRTGSCSGNPNHDSFYHFRQELGRLYPPVRRLLERGTQPRAVRPGWTATAPATAPLPCSAMAPAAACSASSASAARKPITP